MEKKLPHYSLDSIKATFATEASLRMTKTSQDAVFSLGIMRESVVDLIQKLTREQFYKSMTSLADHRIWQDVYHYVKFTTDARGYLVISFKEK